MSHRLGRSLAGVLGGEAATQPWSIARQAAVSMGSAFVITASAFLTFGNERIMMWAGLATPKQLLQLASRDAVEKNPTCCLYLGGASTQWHLEDRGTDGRCDESAASPSGRGVVRIKYGLRGPRSAVTVFAEQAIDRAQSGAPFVAVQLQEVDAASGERAILEVDGARVE